MLYPVLGIKCLAFWAASVLIDVDHYLEFLYHNGLKNFSLREAITFHRFLADYLNEDGFINLSLFHTIESLLLVYLLAFWSGSLWLMAVFYGMVLHVISDAIYLYFLGVLFKRGHSIIEFKIRKGIMESNGLRPQAWYERALDLTGRGTKN